MVHLSLSAASSRLGRVYLQMHTVYVSGKFNVGQGVTELPETIMKAVVASAPKFDFVWNDTISSPVIWNLNLDVFALVFLARIDAGSARHAPLVFLLAHCVFELLPRFDGLALRTSSGTNTTPERARVKVGLRFLRFNSLGASADTHAAMLRAPIKRCADPWIRGNLSPFARIVIAVEEKSTRVDLFQ